MNFKDFLIKEESYKELMNLTKAARGRPHAGVKDRSKERAPLKLEKIDKDGHLHFTSFSLTTPNVDRWDQDVILVDFEEKLTYDSPTKKLLPRVREAIKGDCRVHCECPYFLYFGCKYILTNVVDAIKPGEEENRFPDVRNPNLQGSVCVHLYQALQALPFHANTIAKKVYDENWYGWERS